MIKRFNNKTLDVKEIRIMEKEVLNQSLNMDKIAELMTEDNELEDVNDLAWYFIKGAGNRWILGAH